MLVKASTHVPGGISKGIGRVYCGALIGAVLMANMLTAAEPSAAAELPVMTDPEQFWALTPEQRLTPVPIRIEGRVDYFDPTFHLFWLRSGPQCSYFLLSSNPPALRIGQRVRIEGTLIYDRGLEASRVRVTVLQEREPVEPLDTTGRIGDMSAFSLRIVSAEAYVDSQLDVDADHIRLGLVVDERPVIGWVKPVRPHDVPDWTGKFIRLVGLYSSRFDPTNTSSSIEIWAEEAGLTVLGSLSDYSIFKLPRTPISEIFQVRPGTRVLVQGKVEAHNAGTSVTIRDDSGQIVVRSIQGERLPYGTDVEAIGSVTTEGQRWVLRNGMYRKTAATATSSPPPDHDRTLVRVENVRELSLGEAEQQRPVRILGMVTWSMPGSDFFFAQDVSGGIRVRYDAKKAETPALGKYLEIEGVTANGGSVPEIVLQRMTDRGSMSPPDPRHITFEQAITGKEDGQWVEMRGFVQRTESDGDWHWIFVTTPAGEFVGHLQSPVAFVANPGSLIRVHGVCETTANRLGQLTRVVLRVPFIHSISIEEDAPVDYYDLPRRSIKGLRQLSGVRDMTRVRVIGTVLHAEPGRVVYLQEDDVGLQVLTRQDDLLQPGDTVEVVGILGREGLRVILREAVYRKQGSLPPLRPIIVAEPARLEPALDARLVTIRGILIDAAPRRDHLRLTVQAAGTVFEATLARPLGRVSVEPPLGAGLELTGIYQMVYDDARKTRGFALRVRKPADLVVYQRPRLWNLQRALIACGVLGGTVLLGVGWIAALRRRVRKQTTQLREQMERQAKLEAEVQRAARLESLGGLAGGIAHDFNNLLTIIIGNLGLAMLDPKLTESTSRCLHEIERGTSRARALTRQLLTFAKGGEPLRSAVDLAELVRSAADRGLQGTTVNADYEFSADPAYGSVDRDQITQVVRNLVTNAVEAMPTGGTLKISLRNEDVPEGTRHALGAGRYLRLGFTDSGAGIPPDVLPKIFDPYFSTKKAGSGLGLATVYSIVKRHLGCVEVESSPGHGATFTLWLPAADGPAPVPAPVPPAHFPAVRPTKQTARVLVMEDEPSIQQIVSEVLSRMGIAVTTARDGGEALKEFSLAGHNGAPFDLLILDLTIPGGIGGREVIEMIRKLDPHVPAIVSSGYSSDPVMANYGQHGFQAMVQKPYEIGELVAVIERLLDQRKSRGASVS